MAEPNLPEIRMDAADLYREDIYTDRKVGSIRVLTPVTTEGAQDDTRAVLYAGQAQLLTAVGAVPLSFDIPAASLAEAVEKFPVAAQEAVERTMKELQELRREAASSILIPEPGAGGGFGGPGGPGGLPGGGGGKIQLP